MQLKTNKGNDCLSTSLSVTGVTAPPPVEMSQLLGRSASQPAPRRQAAHMTAEMRKQNMPKIKPAVYKRITMEVCCV